MANSWLEGSYSELYPGVTQDAAGMKRLFRQFSFPGGVGSHATAETPGSIHEGGELGYSLSHAYGAAFDNPDLVVGSLAQVNPLDIVVLPIQNNTGRDGLPLAELRQAFHASGPPRKISA